MKSKISFVGSGNMAWQLAKAFDMAGHRIHQVLSRNEVSGRELAKKFAAFYSKESDNLTEESDFVFLAVPDHAIVPTLLQIGGNGPIFLHCAGSCSLESIASLKKHTGVFYPLQSLSKNRALNFFEVPVFIESHDPNNFQKIWDLADSISNQVKHLDSEKRLYLHLSAVIANNFTNYLLNQASQAMKIKQLPFEWLKPLVEETVKKAFELGPENSQTGPAKRGDEETIAKHLDMLQNNVSLKQIYEIMSVQIRELYPE